MGMQRMRAATLRFAKPSMQVLGLANPRVERVHLQRMRAATLGFAKPSIWVLNLANTRVERVHPQRTRAATLGFAKPSTCMLDSAIPRVGGGGWVYKTEGKAWICQIEHPHAQFCKSRVGRPTKMRMAGG